MQTDLALIGPTLIPPPPDPNTAANLAEMQKLMGEWVAWELAESKAQRAARVAKLPPAGVGRGKTGPTGVFSLRLDHAELAALERRAAQGTLDAAVGDALRGLDEVRRSLSDALD